MKKVTLILFICLSISLSSFAQDEPLTDNAALLFEKSYSQISNAEKNEIFKLSGFEVADNGTQFYIPNSKNSEIKAFNAQIFPIDLNADRIEEIVLVYGKINSSDRAGSSSMLFIKNEDGQYKAHFGLPGSLIFVNLGGIVYPDIIISNSGAELPVWRWNGKHFFLHKNVRRDELKKLNLSNITQASKAFISSFTRE